LVERRVVDQFCVVGLIHRTNGSFDDGNDVEKDGFLRVAFQTAERWESSMMGNENKGGRGNGRTREFLVYAGS